MSDLPQRKSPRLRGYDYSSAGGYFVTVCTHQHKHLFGAVKQDQMILNKVGNIAENCLLEIPKHYVDVEVDSFVVMPNHVHIVIFLIEEKTSLSKILNTYKAAVTREIRRKSLSQAIIWQSSFHDHIIRNEHELNYIRRYVVYNPAKWAEDKFYSDI